MTDDPSWGPGTRAVHAGLPPADQGEPLLAGPGARRAVPPAGRRRTPRRTATGATRNPTWTRARARDRRARRRRDGACSPSGMAAVVARCCWRALRAGDVLVALRRRLPGRARAGRGAAGAARGRGAASCHRHRRDRRRRRGRDARVGRDAVEPGARRRATSPPWPTPRTPRARWSRVDNTVATPLGQRPLDLGADFAMLSAHQGARPGTRTWCSARSRVRDAELAARAARLALAARRDRRARSRPGCAPLARHARPAARAPERERARRRALRCASAPRSRRPPPGLAATRPRDRPRARCVASAPLVGFTLATPSARSAFLAALRAGRRGDELRRRPLDGRAARALGHRRGAGGLHPLLGRLRGPGGPRRRRRAGARRRAARRPPKGPPVGAGPSYGVGSAVGRGSAASASRRRLGVPADA